MDFVAKYAEDQAQLKSLLFKKSTFEEGKNLCLVQNALLHVRQDPLQSPTIWDELVENLSSETFTFRPENEFESIAWCTWHITRIEDAIGNILISEQEQVYDEDWRAKIGVGIKDTANAFTPADVDRFGSKVDMNALLEYRKAVGKRSQEIIGQIEHADLKRKPSDRSLARIVSEGVLTSEKESLWLRDFWANKTIAGLLLLPMTQHQMMHIPNCFKIKNGKGGSR